MTWNQIYDNVAWHVKKQREITTVDWIMLKNTALKADTSTEPILLWKRPAVQSNHTKATDIQGYLYWNVGLY